MAARRRRLRDRVGLLDPEFSLTRGDLDRALSNVDRVVGAERWFGVFSEVSLQRLLLRSRPLIEFLDHYYVFAHFIASFGFMAWVFLRHPPAWGRIRSWFVSVTFAGLVIHVAFPLAPPRMLDKHGFVDALHVYGPNIYSRAAPPDRRHDLTAHRRSRSSPDNNPSGAALCGHDGSDRTSAKPIAYAPGAFGQTGRRAQTSASRHR